MSDNVNAWDRRFRQSTARKRRKAGQRLPSTTIESVRRIDPHAWLQSTGWRIRYDGRRHLVASRGGEKIRLTRKPDGRWLWCDHAGVEGGDLIDLVQTVEGCGFREAVERLAIAPLFSPAGASPPPGVGAPAPGGKKTRSRPRLPPASEEARMIGRQYLQKRGISQRVLAYAEEAGFLDYAGLPGGRHDFAVLFVGRDSQHRIRAVTRRGVFDGLKRDLALSDKRFSPILPASARPGRRSVVWVVEGGVDAMALWELAKRQGSEPPTAIVTGGAHVVAPFLDETTPAYQAIRKADRVIVAHDRERDAATQSRTDQGHDKQVASIARITRRGVNVERWWPREGVKDLGEMVSTQEMPDAHTILNGLGTGP